MGYTLRERLRFVVRKMEKLLRLKITRQIWIEVKVLPELLLVSDLLRYITCCEVYFAKLRKVRQIILFVNCKPYSDCLLILFIY